MNKCMECEKETINPKFCSRSCSAIYNNKKFPKRGDGKEKICKFCGKKLVAEKRQNTFCNNRCSFKFKRKTYIEKWNKGTESGSTKSGKFLSEIIRDYLLEKEGFKCSSCGWGKENPNTKKVPLTVHHKDGNYKNNSKENLEVLCPNCHSLTETYGGANKGNGRKERYN